jgi:hypothetical protein
VNGFVYGCARLREGRPLHFFRIGEGSMAGLRELKQFLFRLSVRLSLGVTRSLRGLIPCQGAVFLQACACMLSCMYLLMRRRVYLPAM